MSTSPVPPAVAVDPSAIDGSFVGERSPLAHTAEIDGEAVVLDEESDRLHLLNHTAALVWHCLDGTSRLDAICDDLAHEMGSPPDQVLAETLDVVRDLASEGLIVASGPAASMSDSGARWQRNPAALWRRSLDGVVVLAPGADEPIVLRGGGPAVWERLMEPITLDGLVEDLADTHGADEEAVERDVRSLLDFLAAAGAAEQIRPQAK